MNDWLCTALVVGALVASTAQAQRPQAEPVFELFHANDLPQHYELKEIRYYVDGRPYFRWTDERGDWTAPARLLLSGKNLEPGKRRVNVEIILAGQSQIFPYLKGYRLMLRGKAELKASRDWILELTTLVGQRGMAVAWEKRVSMVMEGKPRKAVISMGTEPGRLLPENEIPPFGDLVEEPPHSAPVAEIAGDNILPGEPVAPGEPAPEECGTDALSFAFDRSDLEAAESAKLSALADCLRRHPSMQVSLAGHTDPKGPDSYNRRLGQRRASAAGKILITLGVAPARLRMRSIGATDLLCREETPACHARNRRVEVAVSDLREPLVESSPR